MATSSSKTGFVDSWQRGKSVIECNLHMLETEDFSDVTFLVGSEKHVVRAHRYVLASRSCVFHAMFCGRMAEQGEITIPDIEINVFTDFLRFLYTDSLKINFENVVGILYTARKYDVNTLYENAKSFLDHFLCEENLCEILEKSHVYGEGGLQERCLNLLTQSGPQIVKSSRIITLCPNCFGAFLKSERLRLREEKVFEAALAWTKHECEIEGLSPSHENLRMFLGEMVYDIRFASLSLEFLTKVVGPSGILTSRERLRIIDRVSDPNVDISPFKTTPRENVKHFGKKTDFHYVKRFNIIEPTSNQGSVHAVSFSTDKTIALHGCQLFGSDTRVSTRLRVELLDDKDQRVAFPVQNTDWTLNTTVNDVLFPDQFLIKAGVVHTILDCAHD